MYRQDHLRSPVRRFAPIRRFAVAASAGILLMTPLAVLANGAQPTPFRVAQAAAPASTTPSGLVTMANQTQNGVAFISGGVGDDERDALKEIGGDYNLHLSFAVSAGNFLSDIQVKISDAKGDVLVDTVSNGPIFLAKLPAGTYKVAVDGRGQEMTRSVSVGTAGPMSEAFTWPTGG